MYFIAKLRLHLKKNAHYACWVLLKRFMVDNQEVADKYITAFT